MKKQDDLVTKKYLKKELEKNGQELQVSFDRKLDGIKDWMREILDETFLKYRDELMTKVDEWAGYAKKNYEETEVISHKVTMHEGRIEKLETAVFSN